MFNFITAALLILFAALSRLLPHPMNFAPITAIALFSGVYLDRKYAFIIPLAAMVLSDAFMGFYQGIWWVYGSFALIALIGLWLKKIIEGKSSISKALFILGTTLASSVVFFLITNFGVWTGGLLYEMTWNGLLQCYVMAIPFFRNTVAGDLFYVTVMFGLYALIRKFAPKGDVVTAETKKQ
ncbi:MAG: hypothetical protein N2510_00085 [Ignavibacteria bacterium]|nr:hypothetical protein [Ignavibacteria bacterium]